MSEEKKVKGCIKKEVYEEIGRLKKKSINLREEAMMENVDFEKSQALRKEQNNIYKKWQFYQNLTKEICKQRSA